MMSQYFLVFLGGGLGSISRYGLGLAVQPLLPKFPWATMISNALACLILGALVGLQIDGSLSDEKRLLLATGFCGAFSTFSTFTSETWYCFENGQYGAVAANVLGSLAVCFISLFLGIKLTV